MIDMKNIIKRIQNSKGFVSLEVIMIAGVIILIASVILLHFNREASEMSGNALTQLEEANATMAPPRQ
jgi:uncharacterized protein (UPF0333 family)